MRRCAVAQKIRVAVNGLGRIGQHAVRNLIGDCDRVELVGIQVKNTKINFQERARRLMYDPHYGPWRGHDVFPYEKGIVISGHKTPVFFVKDFQSQWGDLGVDIIIDASGQVKEQEIMRKWYVGARKTIITAPANGVDETFVYGVNHTSYDPKRHQIVSNASCTTNCAVPVIWALDKAIPGLVEWSALTVHALTDSQDTMDSANQILWYSSGASGAVEKILEKFRGLTHIASLRVPVGAVSCLYFQCVFNRKISPEELRQSFVKAQTFFPPDVFQTISVPQKNDYSGGYRGNPHSAIVNLESVAGSEKGFLRTFYAWYDNEFAYARRVTDLLFYMAKSEGWLSEYCANSVLPNIQEDFIQEYVARPDY